MKKWISMILVVAMGAMLIACGGSGNNAGDGAGGGTIGTVLAADFKAQAESNSSASALDLANGVLSNKVITFSGATMEVEPGLLNGFGNNEITGFSEGAMFAPMIGTIPFIGYVFTLSDGADTAAFAENLKASGDTGWNICTVADEMVVETSGNKVFFVMCPTSFDD